MAKDYGEMEREFIAGLKQDTGKDLAEWMAAISAAGFGNKNDAIDWLRTQGFLFNRAAWLERIHANGGEPIYAGRAAPPPSRKASVIAEKPFAAPARPEPARVETQAEPPAPSPQHDARLDALIAAAKGYQPLYRLLASEIARALPGVRFSAADGYISLAHPHEFAAIETGPKGLRLALALGARAFDPPLQPARLTGAPRHLSHMIALDDARSVDARLMALVKAAHREANR